MTGSISTAVKSNTDLTSQPNASAAGAANFSGLLNAKAAPSALRSQGQKMAQGAADLPLRRDPVTGQWVPTYQPQANQVTVGGATVAKYPAQSELATLRTGSAYPQAAMQKLNPTVYVLDDFRNAVIPVGSGAQRVVIAHGDFCLGIAQTALPNAKVLPVAATDNAGQLTSEGFAAGIKSIVAQEAKNQNTSKPDLSRVFISMSLGESRFSLVPEAGMVQAISEFTKLGGTFYASAGNAFLNTTTANQGVGIVYANQSVVGSDLGPSPQPAASLGSGTFSIGEGALSKIPTNPLASSSNAYVGAGTVRYRFNPNTRGVEFQNPKGDWVPTIAANRVGAAPVPGMAATGALEAAKPGRQFSAQEAKHFDQWQTTQTQVALARHRMPTGSRQQATTKDLSTAEVKQLVASAREEFVKRYGSNAVMTMAEYKNLAGAKFGSDRAEALDQSLPSGMTAANTYISAEDMMVMYHRPDQGTLHFYSQDSAGTMRTQASYGGSNVSTSAATPDVVSRAVQDRALRLEKALPNRSHKAG